MTLTRSRGLRYLSLAVAAVPAACGSTAAPSQGKPSTKPATLATVKMATETKAVTELPVYIPLSAHLEHEDDVDRFGGDLLHLGYDLA